MGKAIGGFFTDAVIDLVLGSVWDKLYNKYLSPNATYLPHYKEYARWILNDKKIIRPYDINGFRLPTPYDDFLSTINSILKEQQAILKEIEDKGLLQEHIDSQKKIVDLYQTILNDLKSGIIEKKILEAAYCIDMPEEAIVPYLQGTFRTISPIVLDFGW